MNFRKGELSHTIPIVNPLDRPLLPINVHGLTLTLEVLSITQ